MSENNKKDQLEGYHDIDLAFYLNRDVVEGCIENCRENGFFVKYSDNFRWHNAMVTPVRSMSEYDNFNRMNLPAYVPGTMVFECLLAPIFIHQTYYEQMKASVQVLIRNLLEEKENEKSIDLGNSYQQIMKQTQSLSELSEAAWLQEIKKKNKQKMTISAWVTECELYTYKLILLIERLEAVATHHTLTSKQASQNEIGRFTMILDAKIYNRAFFNSTGRISRMFLQLLSKSVPFVTPYVEICPGSDMEKFDIDRFRQFKRIRRSWRNGEKVNEFNKEEEPLDMTELVENIAKLEERKSPHRLNHAALLQNGVHGELLTKVPLIGNVE